MLWCFFACSLWRSLFFPPLAPSFLPLSMSFKSLTLSLSHLFLLHLLAFTPTGHILCFFVCFGISEPLWWSISFCWLLQTGLPPPGTQRRVGGNRTGRVLLGISEAVGEWLRAKCGVRLPVKSSREQLTPRTWLRLLLACPPQFPTRFIFRVAVFLKRNWIWHFLRHVSSLWHQYAI